MDPEGMLKSVCNAIEIMIEIGARYEGLFPSIIDRKTHRMMTEMPPAIPGQRDGDRSHLGCNLIHDEALLRTMYGLAEGLGRPDFSEAADRYLKRFAGHCTGTPTGIFPWGEHAYWDLVADGVGDSYLLRNPNRQRRVTHDHLRQAPLWLLEKLHAFNPACIERFAEGLNGHWTEGEPLEYIRHAYIEENRPYARGARSCDFPRHSGFYIFDWAFAYLRTGREDFLGQIDRMLDYWWPRRDERGLLMTESRSPEGDSHFRNNAPGQTVSLGASLLESAGFIEGRLPDLASRMRERGTVYIDGFLAAPHDLGQGIFVLSSSADTNETRGTMPIWGSKYGVWPACYIGLVALCIYRIQQDDRLLAWAEAVGRGYLEEAFPEAVLAPAMDAGLSVGLLADLYEITGEAKWLQGGLQLAEKLMAIYMDGDLPRGASGIDWYESQMGPSFLLHGLARIALMARDGKPCPLEADYTAR